MYLTLQSHMLEVTSQTC